MRKYQEAIEDCNKSINLVPSYLKAFTRRATCYMQLEQYEEAIRDYQRALDLDPENSDLERNLREAKLELKKSKRKNYYKILGVPKDVDENEIKKAYKKLALKYHPGLNDSS